MSTILQGNFLFSKETISKHKDLCQIEYETEITNGHNIRREETKVTVVKKRIINLNKDDRNELTKSLRGLEG